MSCTIECANPHSAEPIRKITIEAWKNCFRPYMSPSFPHSGVDTVEASRYAVTTQDRWDSPCRSPAMVGQRGGDDRLVERGQQHAEQQGADDQVDPALVQHRGRRTVRRAGRALRPGTRSHALAVPAGPGRHAGFSIMAATGWRSGSRPAPPEP